MRLFRKELLAEMVSKGFDVYAVAPKTEFCTFEELDIELKEIGVTLIKDTLSPTGTNPLKELVTLWRYIKLIKQLRPEVVLSYTVKPIIYGSTASAICRVPKIFSMVTGLGYAFTGDSIARRAIGAIIKLCYRVSFKFCNKVFFQNPDDLNLFVNELKLLPKEKAVRVNGSGVNTERFTPIPKATSNLVFLFCGRLLKDKGINEFVAAAKLIKEKHPDVTFQIVGSLYPNPSSITQFELDALVASNTVQFLGKVKDIRANMQSCSVFVLPSYREGTPHSVLEAMAMEKPIITTDTPGCRETVVNGRNGFLVPPRDSLELAKAMERFISSPELISAMGRESRRYCLEKFDVNNVNSRIMTSMELAA